MPLLLTLWETGEDYIVIDKEWKEWNPRSPGSLRYKQMVDSIESFAKIQADENNF